MSGSLPSGTGVTLVRERPVLARDASQRRGSHNVLPKVNLLSFTLYLNQRFLDILAGHFCYGENAE